LNLRSKGGVWRTRAMVPARPSRFTDPVAAALVGLVI
jgi:hypothetical protein